MTAPQVLGDGKEGQGRTPLRWCRCGGTDQHRMAYTGNHDGAPLAGVVRVLPAPSSAAPVTGDAQHHPEEPGATRPGLTYCKRCGLLLAADDRPDLDPKRSPCRDVKVDLRTGDALRRRIEAALTEPWVVACRYCGAAEWTACQQYDPCPERRADAVLASLAAETEGGR